MAILCEFAHRDNRYKFIVCKILSGNVVPVNGKEASKYMCGFQKFCALTQCYENTDSARGCQVKQRRD